MVKIRLQLQTGPPPPGLPAPAAPAARLSAWATFRHVLRHEGVTALWKGNVPAELLYVCYAAVQFVGYRSATLALQTALPVRLPDAAETFVAGAAAGVAATAITYPLDLLRTRFAAQGRRPVYGSLRGAVRDIGRDEGWTGFFRGLGPACGQVVPFMGIFFAAYEGLRRHLAGLDMPWGSGDAAAGAAASVVAKTVVFPLDLVRKRLQVQGPTRRRYICGDMPEYTSALGAMGVIVQREGLRGLYRGLAISLVKAAPASAVTLWTYEQSLRLMTSRGPRREEPM